MRTWIPLALCTSLAHAQELVPKACDWVTTGTDCEVFACADLDGDGFGDVLTVNGAHQLCVSCSLHGWKATPWRVLRENVPEGVVGIALAAGSSRSERELVVATPTKLVTWHVSGGTLQGDAREQAVPGGKTLIQAFTREGKLCVRSAASDHYLLLNGSVWVDGPWVSVPEPASCVTAPPYEPAGSEGTKASFTFNGDLNGDGRLDSFAVFHATRPHPHRVVRVALAPNVDSGDMDDDGVTDLAEKVLGTDPLDRDTDHDGLLDGWEVHGLPIELTGGATWLDTPLDPRHQDVIVWLSPYDPLTVDQVKNELERSKRLYAELATENPDGSRGVRLHYHMGPAVPKDKQGNWPDVGNVFFPSDCRGLMHWMQVTPWGGGQAQETGDMGGAGNNWAAFAHELGHQLGLSHTGDSDAAWCPFYPSLMSYAFGYSFDGDGEKIHFSDGSLRELVLDEHALNERVPVPFAQVKYLSAPPFRFTLKELSPNETWIDWNHDGQLNAGPVVADVNYGGSTYAGIRRDVGFSAFGPAMTRCGDDVVLAVADKDSKATSLRFYLGDEKWSEPRVLADGVVDREPVLAGTPTEGFVFLHGASGWRVARFDATSAEIPKALGVVPIGDLSAHTIDGRVLLASRAEDGSLSMFRLAPARAADGAWTYPVVPGPALDFTSDVPIDMAQSPIDKHIAVVGSGTNVDGKKRCMKVARFELDPAGKLVKIDERWVGGPHGNVNCTSRPVVRFTDEGRMFLFHTGWPDDNGTWTAWRTQEVADKKLNDGWLVCQMYDVWTRSKVCVAFEIGAKGAVYSYRWDASSDRMNMLQVGHDGLGIDRATMRDFDDGAEIAQWGIRHSILWMRK